MALSTWVKNVAISSSRLSRAEDGTWDRGMLGTGSGQVKGCSHPRPVVPHQDTRASLRCYSPGKRSVGFVRVLWVALGCPRAPAGHSLSWPAALASSGGSSSQWSPPGSRSAKQDASSGVLSKYSQSPVEHCCLGNSILMARQR